MTLLVTPRRAAACFAAGMARGAAISVAYLLMVRWARAGALVRR